MPRKKKEPEPYSPFARPASGFQRVAASDLDSLRGSAKPLVITKDFHCCTCLHNFSAKTVHDWEVPDCPKCKSEDVFDKNDDCWPCTVCRDESIHGQSGKFGFVCDKEACQYTLKSKTKAKAKR